MDPRELFSKPLTYPRHEKGDIHYIGEALPAPSQAVSVLSQGTPASVGGSSVPAREDHVHAIDLNDLIAAIEDLPDPIDLSGYYTSAQVDTLLESYYTITEVDAIITSIDADIVALADILTDHESRIDALESAGGGGISLGDFTWSYTDSVCDPSFTILSDVWMPPGSIEIIEVVATARIQGTSEDYDIDLYVNGSSVDDFVWAQPSTSGSSGALSIAVDETDRIQVAIGPTSSPGDAEDVMIIVRYGPP